MKFHLFSIAAATALFITSCTDNNETSKVTLAKGGKTYGGEVTFMSSEKVTNFFPYSTVDAYSQLITGQVFEPILKINTQTMQVVGGIAESYSVNSKADVYTFKLREGVFFHGDDCIGDEGREVTVDDMKYSLEFACSQLPLNVHNDLLVGLIAGSEEFYAASKTNLPKKGVSGIRMVDAKTLEIQLTKPFVGFEKLMTHPNLVVFPREAYEKYGKDITAHPVGTGPFKLDEVSETGVRLVKNEKYWQKDGFGNKLPYLAALNLKYTKSKKDEMLAFRKSEIDLVFDIPVEEIENVMGTLEDAKNGKNVKHKIVSSSSFSMDYVAFNHEHEVFKNVGVRQALWYALNTTEIVDLYLMGEGNPANNGFIPVMDGYPVEIDVAGQNVDKAKSLLAAAGYPEGKGFPETTFFVNSVPNGKAHKMAIGIVEQWKKNLGIPVKIQLCSYEERDKAVKSGQAAIWRAGWIVDYPDPLSFISIFNYSGMGTNDYRYNNPVFNQKYSEAQSTSDFDKRMALIRQCSQIIMQDAVALPITSDNVLMMVNARVRGLEANPLESINFANLYIKEPKAEKE